MSYKYGSQGAGHDGGAERAGAPVAGDAPLLQEGVRQGSRAHAEVARAQLIPGTKLRIHLNCLKNVASLGFLIV